MPMRDFHYELMADYFQFYLQDESSEGNLADSWTPEATDRLLALAPGVVGIGTVRNMPVPVTIQIHEAAPVTDHDDWDHVTECSLRVESGRIVVAGCTDYVLEAARIEVEPGDYRVRTS